MMASGFAGGPGAAAPAEPQEEEVEAPASVQSAFTLKLVKTLPQWDWVGERS